MNYTYKRELFVCKLCGFVNCHQLQYCPKCPGLLVKQVVDYPHLSNIEILTQFCKERGWNYIKGVSY